MANKNFINQTNRTILFEEINPEKMDLITLIDDSKDLDSLDDERIIEINKHLLVSSFDEFLTKFEPKVYSYYNAETQSIKYILKKPEGIPEELITEIKIDNGNTFFKMLNTLIEARKSQGNRNVDFKFENILELISPKKVIEDIKQTRKEIAYIYNKYEELDEGNPKKLEYGDRLNAKFEEASQNYSNVLGMLPLAIEDIKTRLLLGHDENSLKSEKIKLGMLQVGDKGELEVIEYKQEETKDLALIEEKNSTALVEAFREDYNDVAEEPNQYISDLVVRTFVPLAKGVVAIEPSQEVENYNNYLEFYKAAQEDFVKIAKPLIEKLLGVKMFFEQYNAKVSLMKPTLLVTNIKAEMIVKAGNKERLQSFFNTVNAKNDFDNAIWFGIYPNVDLDIKKGEKKVRERFKGTKNEEKSEKNTIESLTNLMSVLSEYKVQVFFNFEGTYETSFDNLATTGVDKYIEKTRMLEDQKYSEYLVPAIPNFTIIPKDKSGVVLDFKMKYKDETGVALSKEKEDLLKFWIEGVYIDASYVAAGIVAAYQCPNYLKDRFNNVSPVYPGVRFDIEAEDNSYKAKTTMSKEISGFTNTIKDKINQFSYGFIFSSDSAHLKKEKIKNIVVYKARTLAKNVDGNYEPLYKTLTTTFIERTLRFVTTDFKEDKLNFFFSTNPESQKSVWIKDEKFVNGIMQKGDDLSHVIDEDSNVCQLNIVFSGNVKNLQVEINKN
ncbi:hypothetical protein [Pseudoleptotrichia goodfellowii]|uniref:Uncharacterized protein n=1 Tax=Pseudoleptotrichia goodfellowii TaxID=157692 RepID=A0A510J8C5_9FUSO|nr:hypothetical protein [Pseudoleptotrichia goodfellowii]MBF4805384.1 transcriptional regulator [Pseudoleptotrichia goodfellowii]BBM35306.1 hypothetical protein JCM16774_0213 [Pseudoleptotrichia goodfellowii]